MSSSTSNSKAAALARVQALVAGAQKRFPNGSFTLGKTVFTTATLVQLFESLIAAITALNTAQASAKDAGTALAEIAAKVGPIIRLFRRHVLTTFGAAATELLDFGMTPEKVPAPRTPEQRAATKAKLNATRKARGTESKKSKLAVKGDVTGVIVTPVVGSRGAPVTPTAPASPSPQPVSPASSTPSPAPQGNANATK
jgi:hypothetical protein